MSYPCATIAVADINGNYNISGGGSGNIPDPIQLGTINPITGNSTITINNSINGPIDLKIEGQRLNQDLGLFCNDNPNEYLNNTFEGDIGLYYNLTNDSLPPGLFCIGERGNNPDLTIGPAAITFNKQVNFNGPTNVIVETKTSINGTFSGIFGVGVGYTVPVNFILHKNMVFMNIEAVIHNMPISSGIIQSNPFIPASYVDASNIPRSMLCAGVDFAGPKVCNVGLQFDIPSGKYLIDVYPLSTANFTGGGNAGFEQVNVSWQR